MENLNFEDLIVFGIAILIMSSPLWIMALAYFMSEKYGHPDPYLDYLFRECIRAVDEIEKISGH